VLENKTKRIKKERNKDRKKRKRGKVREI